MVSRWLSSVPIRTVALHYTTQDCPKCGNRQKKSLSQRTHRCDRCNYTAPRDVAAAIDHLLERTQEASSVYSIAVLPVP
ncbi:hypothetical protein NIES593_18470 [Hydrococcus rivularis NIES-593]|uniref:Cas12f1-like TNB domain-containing protein n=1 Tax=Hydrococcus rivularis NIES-593 TaxID=1921803 RepID=A0A1U7HAD4_9CYAN|nr:zinc ribbon domain-containing protein [Hydrococcus rivularis]OKH20498.1 hypothetical protein NIES593_18470 [Hydrococcus rivularis NIES-593]